MIKAGTSLARSLAVAAAFAITMAMPGCLDLDQQIAFKADGSGVIETSLQFDQEMEDVAAFIETIGLMSKNADALKDGLCGAFQTAADRDPIAGVKMTSKQFTLSGKYICQVRLAIADVTRINSQESPVATWLKVKPSGPRQFLLSLDLSDVPEVTPEMQSIFVQSLRSGSQQGQADPSAPPLSAEETAAVWSKFQGAISAYVKLFMKNRTVQLTVAAPKIVESNGVIAPGNERTQFKFSWSELADLALYPEKRKGKSFYALIEY